MNTGWTLIPVVYRDDANYKQWCGYLVEGRMSPRELAELDSCLEDGCFVPTQIGLPHLGENGWDSFPDDDDHAWHEMDVAAAEHVFTIPGGPVQDVGTPQELLGRFREASANGWDPTLPDIEFDSNEEFFRPVGTSEPTGTPSVRRMDIGLSGGTATGATGGSFAELRRPGGQCLPPRSH